MTEYRYALNMTPGWFNQFVTNSYIQFAFSESLVLYKFKMYIAFATEASCDIIRASASAGICSTTCTMAIFNGTVWPPMVV